MNANENDKSDNSKQPKEEKSIKRREFISKIGYTATGATVAGGLAVVYKYLSPNVLMEIPPRFKIAPIQSLQPGSYLFNPEHRVFVFREKQGYIFAVSAICTHLGCTTMWSPNGIPGHEEGVIRCPCHGSIFSKTGEVLHGPATRHLDRFRLTLEDGQLVVDTEEKVKSVEDMILKT